MAAIWPAPPPFYKHFTRENVAQIRQLRKEAGLQYTTSDKNTSNTSNPTLDKATLPPSLLYLLPPPPPPHDTKYTIFGSTIDLSAPPLSLPEAGVEQLFPDSASVQQNPQPYLLSLSRSLLTKFLELAGVLSLDPTQGLDRTQDLRTMMNNMHFLINQYRPHQARETMILMFEERITRLRDEVARIREGRSRVEAALDEMGRMGSGECEEGEERGDVDMDDEMELRKAKSGREEVSEGDLKLRARQKAAWAALERLPEMESG